MLSCHVPAEQEAEVVSEPRGKGHVIKNRK